MEDNGEATDLIRSVSWICPSDTDLSNHVCPLDRTLVEMARSQGFYSTETEQTKKAETWVSDLFYFGGQIIFREGLTLDEIKNPYRYLTALMRCYNIAHADKVAVAALILSHLAQDVIRKPSS